METGYKRQVESECKEKQLYGTPKSISAFTRDGTDTQAPYTQKMKDICVKIFQKSTERIKRSRQDYDFRQEHNQRVKKIVQSFRCYPPSKALQQDLGLEQLNGLIQKIEFKISRIVNNNIDIKKQFKLSAKSLQRQRKERQQAHKQKQILKQANRKCSLTLAYVKYLKNHLQKSELAKSQIIIKICQKQQQIRKTKQEIKSTIEQYCLTQKLIKQQLQNERNLLNLFQQQCVKKIVLSHQKIPNQKQMINCMFLVGILGEQNFILNLNKQMKGQKVNKIHNNLSRRQILVDCQNSQIIELKIITVIYMHCKSLLLNNIVTLMKTLSFFSDQLRSIYHYKSLEKYMLAIMEKVKLNLDWMKIKDSIQTSSKDIPICKKKLIIFIKAQYITFLSQILEVLQDNEKYQICVGTHRVIVEWRELSQQNQSLQGTSQYNQLTLKLHKYMPTN